MDEPNTVLRVHPSRLKTALTRNESDESNQPITDQQTVESEGELEYPSVLISEEEVPMEVTLEERNYVKGINNILERSTSDLARLEAARTLSSRENELSRGSETSQVDSKTNESAHMDNLVDMERHIIVEQSDSETSVANDPLPNISIGQALQSIRSDDEHCPHTYKRNETTQRRFNSRLTVRVIKEVLQALQNPNGIAAAFLNLNNNIDYLDEVAVCEQLPWEDGILQTFMENFPLPKVQAFYERVVIPYLDTHVHSDE